MGTVRLFILYTIVRIPRTYHQDAVFLPIQIFSALVEPTSSWEEVPQLSMLVSATLSQLGNRRAVLCSISLLISCQVVRSFAVQSFFGRLTPLATTAAPTRAKMTSTDDPYIFLEEVESEESLQFAKDANDACLKALGDPTKSKTTTYDR
jgi:hypothetical protein